MKKLRLRDSGAIQRRNEKWRIAHDLGIVSEGGVIIRQSIAEIAEESRFTPQHVRAGIRSARKLREAIRRATAAPQRDPCRNPLVCA